LKSGRGFSVYSPLIQRGRAKVSGILTGRYREVGREGI
jgi:hypothetical protein